MRSVPLARVALPLTLSSAVLAGGCRTVGAPVGVEPRLPTTMGGADTRADGRLANGVRVIVEENHAAPVVAVQVWVAGGAAADPPGLEGSAHFFEHLLLRGTKRRAPGAAARDVEAVGGSLGAWTGPDETVFHATVAAPYFDLGVDVLGDAVSSPRFDPAEVERARRIILDEIASAKADPARVGGEALLAAAFPGRGYGRPLLGTAAGVGARTPAELASRFGQAYVGGALTVVVVGDVDGAAARAAVARAFAAVPAGPAPEGEAAGTASPRSMTVERVLGRGGSRKAADPSAELLLGFRSPAPSPEDAAAFDLLAALMARGDAGRLEREIVRNRSLADGARAFTFCSRAAGLLALALPSSPRRMGPATQAALDVAFRLGREEVGADELARARVAVQADVARGEAGVEARARRLGFAAAVARDLDWGDRYRAGLESLGPAELRAAAARLLRADALTVAAVLPEGAPAEADAGLRGRLEALVAGAGRQLDRAPGSPVAAAPLAGGDVVRVVASSGARLIALRDPGARLVTVEAAWASGPEADAGSGATAALAAALLARGTRTRTAAEIASELRALGGTIEGFAAPGVFGLRAEMLPAGVERGLAILADCVFHPSFPDDELERERRALVERLRVSPAPDGGPDAALRLFRETLGPGHPRSADVDAVSSVGRVQLLDQYRRGYPSARLVVAIVGDISPGAVLATASALLGGPAPANLSAPAPSAKPPSAPVATALAGRFAAGPLLTAAVAPAAAPAPPAIPAPVVQPTTVFRKSTRPDAEAVIGYPTFAPGDPDRLATELLAEILNADGGRLSRLVTADKTFAVRTVARVAPAIEPGYLAVALSCAPPRLDASVAAVRAALADVAANGVTADEVSRAARRLVGARAAALRSRTAIAHALIVDEARGLAPLAYRQEATALARLGAADVARAAKRAFDPTREIIAVITGAGK